MAWIKVRNRNEKTKAAAKIKWAIKHWNWSTIHRLIHRLHSRSQGNRITPALPSMEGATKIISWRLFTMREANGNIANTVWLALGGHSEAKQSCISGAPFCPAQSCRPGGPHTHLMLQGFSKTIEPHPKQLSYSRGRGKSKAKRWTCGFWWTPTRFSGPNNTGFSDNTSSGATNVFIWAARTDTIKSARRVGSSGRKNDTGAASRRRAGRPNRRSHTRTRIEKKKTQFAETNHTRGSTQQLTMSLTRLALCIHLMNFFK